MTSPRLADCEARRASVSLFPGVEDTSASEGVHFLGGISPISPEIFKFPKSEFFVADRLTGPFFKPSIFINNIYLLLYNTRKR